MHKFHIHFVENFKIYIMFPIVIAIVGIIIALIFGVDLDINFKGGSRFTFTYENEIVVSDVQNVIEDNLGKQVEVTQSTSIADSTSKLVVSIVGTDALSSEVQASLLDELQSQFPDNNIQLGDSNTVNPTVAHSFFVKAVVAVLFAGILVVIYIGIRFRKIGGISSGLMALAALIIDCSMAFFTCVFFRLQIDMNFIAVILTILGYSLNDTVVVYDRIRENRDLKRKMSTTDLVDLSINQVFTRSLTTSIATFTSIMTIVVVGEIFGITTLRTFALPMAVGIVSGCYTSVCVSAPLWVKWIDYKKKKDAEKRAAARKAKAKA